MNKDFPRTFIALMSIGVALLHSASALASGGFKGCYSPCGPLPSKAGHSSVVYKRGIGSKSVARPAAKNLGGESLQGWLAGQWDTVNAVITFPWEDIDGLDLQVVALGLPAQSVGQDQYRATGWNRELFFLDIGDSVPRLLSAYLLDPAFVPDPDEALIESGQLWFVPYVLYQEAAELAGDPDFYAGFPDGAASADILFVTDEEGNVKDISVDIFDTAGEYQYSVLPQVGDRYNPGFIAYDLSNPDILYVLTYFDEPVEFTDDVALLRRYFVPNGTNDPQLPSQFESGELELSFLLEGSKVENDEGVFEYSPLQALGYTWAEAKDTTQTPASGGGSGATAPWLLMLLASLTAWSRRANRLAQR